MAHSPRGKARGEGQGALVSVSGRACPAGPGEPAHPRTLPGPAPTCPGHPGTPASTPRRGPAPPSPPGHQARLPEPGTAGGLTGSRTAKTTEIRALRPRSPGPAPRAGPGTGARPARAPQEASAPRPRRPVRPRSAPGPRRAIRGRAHLAGRGGPCGRPGARGAGVTACSSRFSLTFIVRGIGVPETTRQRRPPATGRRKFLTRLIPGSGEEPCVLRAPPEKVRGPDANSCSEPAAGTGKSGNSERRPRALAPPRPSPRARRRSLW